MVKFFPISLRPPRETIFNFSVLATNHTSIFCDSSFFSDPFVPNYCICLLVQVFKLCSITVLLRHKKDWEGYAGKIMPDTRIHTDSDAKYTFAHIFLCIRFPHFRSCFFTAGAAPCCIRRSLPGKLLPFLMLSFQCLNNAAQAGPRRFRSHNYHIYPTIPVPVLQVNFPSLQNGASFSLIVSVSRRSYSTVHQLTSPAAPDTIILIVFLSILHSFATRYFFNKFHGYDA